MPREPSLERQKEAAVRQAREARARAAQPPPEPEPPPPEPPREEAHSDGLAQLLFQDSERTLILLLLVLLSEEEGHQELVFALLYLLI